MQPFMFEDQTGDVDNTEYADLWDRMTLGVSSFPGPSTPQAPPGSKTLRILELSGRSMRHGFSTAYPNSEAAAVLEFGAGGALGAVRFAWEGAKQPMSQWLHKTRVSKFGKSPICRRFKCSDGQMYTWTFVGKIDCEWHCTTENDYNVARYTLKVPHEPAYRSSGRVLTIEEAYAPFAVELLAALTIMRHLQRQQHL